MPIIYECDGENCGARELSIMQQGAWRIVPQIGGRKVLCPDCAKRESSDTTDWLPKSTKLISPKSID